MTPRERRGRTLFLILASVLILEKLTDVGFAFSKGLAEVKWSKSVLQPLCLAASVAFLWQGDRWLRWLVGAVYVFSGGVQIYLMAHFLGKLAQGNIGADVPPEKAAIVLRVLGAPIGVIGVFGLLHLLAGLLFLLSPSMIAFFRYQREGPQWWFYEAEHASTED